jgi:hypothetical protein
MMGACGADDDVGVLLRQMFKKLRFQMIDHSPALRSGFRLQAPAALTPALRLKFKSLPLRHSFLAPTRF